jgi:hypothetical protein
MPPQGKAISPANIEETSPAIFTVGRVVFVVRSLVYLLPLFLKIAWRQKLLAHRSWLNDHRLDRSVLKRSSSLAF